MAENESNAPSDKGLILVSLDFHDGSKCKVWLQPDVVCKLQQGDDKLMEDLRQQFVTSAPKRKGDLVEGEDGDLAEGEDSKRIKKEDGDYDKILPKQELAEGFSGEQFKIDSTYHVEDGVVKAIPAQTAPTVGDLVIDNTVQATPSENFGNQLVDALGNVDQYSYLEELTVGEDNYIELAPGTTYTIQDGMLIEEHDQGRVYVKQESQRYSPNIERKKRKKGLRRYMKYSVEDRDEAIKLIKSGELSQQQASRKFNIPQGTLSDHVRSGGLQWKCSICLRKFAQRLSLEQHHLTHFESRPYLCDLCGFNTRDRASLLKHRMKRHVDAENPMSSYEEDLPGVAVRTAKQTAWTAESTRAFLEEYEKCLDRHDSTAMKKKYVWQMVTNQLCERGYYVTCTQVHNKWKTMLNSYKLYTSNRDDRRVFSYADEMEAFLQRNEVKGLDFDGIGQQPQEKLSWDYKSISLLIAEYESRIDKFDSNLMKKKVLWKEIHGAFRERGYKYSFGQVQNKWKVLVRSYKSFKSSSLMNDAAKYFQYYEQFDRIFSNSSNEQMQANIDYIQDGAEEAEEEGGMVDQQFVVPDVTTATDEQVAGITSSDVQFIMVNEEGIIKSEDIANQIVTAIEEGHTQGSDDNTVVIEESLADIPAIDGTLISTDDQLVASNPADSTALLSDPELLGGKERVDWSDESVRLLLAEYEALLSKFRNPMVKKKLLWLKIHEKFTERGHKMTAQQIENKWRVLTRNYTKACSEGVVANNDSYPYFEETKKIQEMKLAEFEEESVEPINVFPQGAVGGIEDLTKVWTKSATLQLLNEYKKRQLSFDNSDVKKKVLWQEIAEVLEAKGVHATPAQVENKWKVLLKSYKVATSGGGGRSGGKPFQYLQKMDEILKSRNEENSSQGGDGTTQDHCHWSQEATLLLFREYGVRLEKFDSEYVKRKEYLWQEIACVLQQHGHGYTVPQLMNKWKSSLKKYRTVVDFIYDESVSVGKRRKKLASFPFLIEVGQLLGHSHDLSAILPAGEDFSADGDGKGKKWKKGRFEGREPQTASEILKYFKEYESQREELDNSRFQQLQHLISEQLSNIQSSENLSEQLKVFESRREQFEKQRMDAMTKMHQQKMAMLKRLLKAVKKSKT